MGAQPRARPVDRRDRRVSQIYGIPGVVLGGLTVRPASRRLRVARGVGSRYAIYEEDTAGLSFAPIAALRVHRLCLLAMGEPSFWGFSDIRGRPSHGRS
jgi:hypothetical protein